MPAFQFETNLPIILLIIVISLVSLYFYLDLKKVKLVNEELEKKNEMIIKEIDNIHLRLHKFFNGMPSGVVPISKMAKSENIKKVDNSNIDNNKNEMSDKVENEMSDKFGKIIDDTINSEISENEFNNLKKKPSNNIFGEIEDIISDTNNNIIQERNIDENIVLPELVPVTYESEKINDLDEKINTDEEINTDDEDEEVDDVSQEDNSDDENISDDLDEDLLEKYMKMSYKDLKEKCIEMNLKHSGNKTTLSKRIVENL